MYRHWDRKGTPPSEFHSSDDEMKRLAMENAFKSHVLRQLAKSDLSNDDLTRLWNLYPDNVEARLAPEGDFLPKMEDYFEDAIEQLVPANMVEEQYK